MKTKTIFALFVALCTLLFYILIGNISKEKQPSQIKRKINQLVPTLIQPPPSSIQSRSIFVPYWSPSLSEEDGIYDTYYYFGIAPGAVGTIQKDAGYQNILLIGNVSEKKKKLVLRMLDTSVIEALLTDKMAQKTLISNLQGILAENVFSGLILDIEVPFTLQANKREQITYFVQQICIAIKSDYKTCDMLIYGDFAYRNRPYDLKKIGEVVDTVLLMAYDFHKAGGEPGPNFPFDRRSSPNTASEGGLEFGYDFKTMIADALKLVPKDKIEVVFGMYGYDWTLNTQGTPLNQAQALSVNSIKLKVESQKLQIISNEAKEKRIDYSDHDGRSHIIWYEDEESVTIKIDYLKALEVGKVSFWAYGYF